MQKELSKKLLSVLACPACKGHLLYKKEEKKLVCKKCSSQFKVKNNIPIMLIKK